MKKAAHIIKNTLFHLRIIRKTTASLSLEKVEQD